MYNFEWGHTGGITGGTVIIKFHQHKYVAPLVLRVC